MRPFHRSFPGAILLAATMAIGPTALQGQGVSLGVNAGTTGVGGNLVLGLTSKLGLRAGLGVLPFSFEGDLDEATFTIEPPPLFGTAGLDVQLIGPLRVMAGVLYRSDDVRFDAEFTSGREVGDEFYDESGTLSGALTSSSVAPYLGIGFGRVIGAGIGFYTDFGVAFTGDPGVEVTASGDITEVPGFYDDLEQERQKIEADLSDVYRYWPMLSIGINIGFGG
jgi:hypothetical protein